ncbi:MAG: hypothetical protein JXR81_07080 [Candidatus Goldbacteria bacterium]|nr:hypothetical protein [Candidatus Goldiibacteriota bacterium]
MKKLITISCALIILFNCTGCATLASYFVPEKKDNYLEYLNPMAGFYEMAERQEKIDAFGQKEKLKTKNSPENTALTIVMSAVFIAGTAIGATTAYKDAEPHVRNGAFLFGIMGALLGAVAGCIVDVILFAVVS